MRVLYLFAHYFPEFLGGGEVSNRLMVKALAARHDVAVVSLADRTPAGRSLVDGVPVEYVRRVAPGFGKLHVVKHRSNVRAAWRRVRAAAKEFRPDLVHASGLDATALAYRLHEATGVPYIVHARSYGEKCVNPLRFDEAKCATCTYWWLAPPARPLLRAYHQKPTREAVRRAARVVCISQFVRRMMEGEGATRLEVVYNPVDIDLPPRFSLREKKPRLLFAGGLSPQKGVPQLLEAYARFRRDHRDVPLVLVGEGAVGQLPTGAETWGRLPYERLLAEMRDSRLCVFPSRVPEPFGRVAAEAQAVGTLVVGSALGGMPEILPHGFTAAPEPEAIADALEHAWALPDAEYEERARRAHAFVRETCDLGRFTERIDAFYREVAG